jgi:cyclopropane-fatty-acyl-phospholipid synthase
MITPASSPSVFRSAVLARLRELRVGHLTLRERGETATFGDASSDLRATVTIHHPSFWRAIALGGTVGGAEAYRASAWECDDLTALFRIFTRDSAVTDRLETGSALWKGLAYRLEYLLRANTREGSRKNIHDHYDLGNDFFALWLDDSMTYSAGYYASADATLAEAQEAKLERICQKLRLAPGDRLIEVGGGWGSLAIHAAKRYGARVTTTTISAEQHAVLTRRVAEAGLTDRVTVLQRDYRDLRGEFDKLVSIEMIEAVGYQFYATYFATCASLLTPEGVALIQAITIQDQRYELARRRPEFIRRYVFPGSCIPSITALCGAATRSSDLRLVDMDDMTSHYARTLADWRAAFNAQLGAMRAMGYPDDFIRFWDFYLAYCEAGFREHYIGSVQLLWAKPGWRDEGRMTP